MVIQNTLGLGIAVLLHRRPRTRRLLQTLYAMPYLVSPIVIGYLWTLLLSPDVRAGQRAAAPGRARVAGAAVAG